MATNTTEPRDYFVSVIKGELKAMLLGPYETHAEALANVDRGRDLANKADLWSVFYAFGTASAPRGLVTETVFGK